jgi:hypothetical protein
MINIHAIIMEMYPNIVTMRGDVAYDKDDNEVSYDQSVVNAYIAKNEYKEKRAKEYPPFTEYLDGIVKGDTAQVDAYIAACQAVKDKYPRT